MSQLLKIGTSGVLVEALQSLLNLPQTGVYDGALKKAVISIQTRENLKPDGIVGPLTWKVLGIQPSEVFADTDANTSATWITQYNLPEGEYVDQDVSKKWIFVHHNSGVYDPYKQIDNWANDQRGRVGSNYVIGGLNSNEDASSNGSKVDGLILQAIHDNKWGYHLGPVKSHDLNKNSISIELCSAGALTFKDGKYFTWFNTEVHPSQVVTLLEPHVGYKHYHRYSEKQIESLKALFLLLADKHGINIKSGLYEAINTNHSTAFKYNQKCSEGKVEQGIISHSNVNPNKTDVFPQPELIQMIKSL
jgi:hypothetical protein